MIQDPSALHHLTQPPDHALSLHPYIFHSIINRLFICVKSVNFVNAKIAKLILPDITLVDTVKCYSSIFLIFYIFKMISVLVVCKSSLPSVRYLWKRNCVHGLRAFHGVRLCRRLSVS